MNPIVIFIIVFILEGISFFGYSKVASIVRLYIYILYILYIHYYII